MTEKRLILLKLTAATLKYFSKHLQSLFYSFQQILCNAVSLSFFRARLSFEEEILPMENEME